MLKFLKAVLKRYGSDDIANKAAALSYYTVFSLGPLLFIIFGIVGLMLKNTDYKNQLSSQLTSLLGAQASGLVNGLLNNQQLSAKTGWAFVIGIVGLILGCIGIFGQLQKSLNDILRVKPGPGAGVKAIVRQKLISLGLVGVVAFLLIVSLVVSAFSSTVTGSGAGHRLWLEGYNFIVSLVLSAALLTLLYRTLPAVKIAWGLLFKVSLVIALLLGIGQSLLGIIIGRNSSITAFGAAGSLIALLLWIFYSGQIVYLGASVIGLYTNIYNIKVEPKFSGKAGVLKIKRIEQPMDNSVAGQLKDKFIKGFRKNWRQK